MIITRHWRKSLWASCIAGLAVWMLLAKSVPSLCAQEINTDSLKTLLQSSKDTTRVNMFINLARVYRYASVDSSLRYAQEAEQLARSLGYQVGVGNALLYIALTEENRGLYDAALEHLFAARKIFLEQGNKSGLARCLNMIGLVYESQRRYEQALDCYKQSLQMYEELEHQERIALMLANVASIYHLLGNDSTALTYLTRSLALYKTIGHPEIFWAQYNMGLVLMRQGRTVEAQDAFRQALSGARAIRSHRTMILSTYNLAKLFLHEQRNDSAEMYARQAVVLAQQSKLREELQDSYKVLSEVYKAMGNHKQALEEYERYVALKDSLNSAQIARNIADLQTRVETEQQQSEIQTLSRLRNALVALVVLIVAFVALLVNRYIQKRRNEALLQEINAELMRQQALVDEQTAAIELANTELLHTNEALAAKNRQLADINSEKNDALGIVAHDLKNPISNIRLLVKLLEEEYETLSPAEVQEYAGDIRTLTDQMFDLVTNILDVNAIEQGTLHLSPMLFDVAATADAVIKQYEKRAAEKQLTIHVEHTGDSLVAFADKSFTMEVLDNLVSNAVKYSPLGKNIFVRVLNPAHVPALQGGQHEIVQTDMVRIEIQDEGPGLTPDDKQQLFKKFTRLSAKPTAGEHSTGLGLSIVKKMVEAMKGRVWCESEYGHGATFIVELPIHS